MMKVGINTTALLAPKSGIGQYVHQLTQRLLMDADLDMAFFCGLNWGRQPAPISHNQKIFNVYAATDQKADNVSVFNRHLKRAGRAIRQVAFAAGAKPWKLDLYHEPNFISFKLNKPTVITVHDMSPFRLPDCHRPDIIDLFNRKFAGAVERSSAIIVDSHFVRNEVLDCFPNVERKISPVYLAAGPEFQPQAAPACAMFLASAGLKFGEYILAVGTLEPRKNLLSAIRAYAKLPESLRQKYPFAIAGMRGWLHDDFEAEARTLINKGQIRMLGYVDDADLPLLYSGAAVMAYPSIYEGFGLPPLEAMACGTPVITSNVASLPEVVGTAGLMVAPYDVDALKEAMQRVLEDRDYAANLSAQGLLQARKFSWEKTAAETVAVYRKVLGR